MAKTKKKEETIDLSKPSKVKDDQLKIAITEANAELGDALTFVEPNGELRDKYIKLTS